MNNNKLTALLENVKNGDLDISEALYQLKVLPFEDIGHTKIDHHRFIRQGIPEVIYCEGKTVGQVIEMEDKLTLFGVEFVPDCLFLGHSAGFTVPASCAAFGAHAMRIVGPVPMNCAEVWAYGYGIEADFDRDCRVTFRDLRLFCDYWLLCNDPCDANCPD